MKSKFRFYPTLLDAFQNYVESDTIWEKYYGNSENPSITAEDFHDQKLQDLFDSINRVDGVYPEAAAKGTCLNEIVDRIITNQNPSDSEVIVKSVKDMDDCVDAFLLAAKSENSKVERMERAKVWFTKIGQPFIYASVGGYDFCFDVAFCKEIAKYYEGSLCQYRTSANLETCKGLVELYGYIDYVKERTIYDLKTTKSYTFGNYAKYNQRHAYPYCMTKSGMMEEVREFEFTAYQLMGGNSRNPLITGKQNREVYTYSPKQSEEILRANCERFIDFINDNMDKINLETTKIFEDKE